MSSNLEHAALDPTRRELLQMATAGVIVAGLAVSSADAVSQHATGTVVTVAAPLSVTVNGIAHSVDIDPRMSVLDLLRERLGLTGTKKGCNQGACGACTILMDGRRVNACLTLAIMHDGAAITTIEGLADGDRLHPLQAAFIEHEGFQCGFCTAGQIMSGVACIAEGHAKSEEDVRFWMSGNICRCGAYPGIVAAVTQTAQGA